jgi:hypothetical protein
MKKIGRYDIYFSTHRSAENKNRIVFFVEIEKKI